MNLGFILPKLVRLTLLSCIPLLFLGCTAQALSATETISLAENYLQSTSPLVQQNVNDSDTGESQAYITSSMGSLAGSYPTTLEEFLKLTSLIVTAELGDVEYLKIVGYDETGKLAEPTEDQLKRGALIDVADFTLKVEEVLWADEKVVEAEPVILRVMWDFTPGWNESFEKVDLRNFALGDRYLFILEMNPDGTYGVTYDEHRLTVDDQGVLYYSQMYPPYPAKHGPFTEGERYSEERGTPLTVDDLVRAAQAKNGQ